jgi:hypothetical protein
VSVEDVTAGAWWDATVDPNDPRWKCPECGVASNVADWAECEYDCDESGSCTHDGRECPECGEVYDHVWGAEKIQQPDRPAEVTL